MDNNIEQILLLIMLKNKKSIDNFQSTSNFMKDIT